jgi:hypothetical protein
MEKKKSIIRITPEIPEMEKLFGLNNSLFWTVKSLKEKNPLLLKRLTINSHDFEDFKKPFIVHRFDFSNQDYYNFYYISIRMRSDRNMNGKVIKLSGLRTEADKQMQNMVVDRQGESWVTFREHSGHPGNFQGARYRLFRTWMALLTPWLAKRHGLKKKNQCRLVIILLLIISGFEEFEQLFEEWKQHPDRLEKEFQPSVLPLDPEFVSMLDKRLRQQVKKTTRNVNPRFRDLQDFLEVINKCNLLPVTIEKVPLQIARIMGEPNTKARLFTKEDIEYILYRLRLQNHKKYFTEQKVWPKKFELPKNHFKIIRFKMRYENQKKGVKNPIVDKRAEEKLKKGDL